MVVYMATLPCGRSYVGKTRRLKRRIGEHLSSAKKTTRTTRFANALAEVDPSQVKWKIIGQFDFLEGDQSELLAVEKAASLEIAAMEFHGTVDPEFGFNCKFHTDKVIKQFGLSEDERKAAHTARCRAYYLSRRDDPDFVARRSKNNDLYRLKNKEFIKTLSKKWHRENAERESLRSTIRARRKRQDLTYYENFLLDVVYDLLVRKRPKLSKNQNGGYSK
ncbi:GIY-YIG nuclease family protein [Agrobacterium tumefaciens]|uniref:GIY-YIG nuclease family protein n=1 Tax=Agrobacterium tumefaciens TaxID=358 RepID=UPI001572A074|nr:GIY-YIG nuclease family protein [Agrobacterium tumefaciens]NSZ63468.1 GIY-YIG nuclease family protein [Agrobacterium tumefaciens]NTA69838.1 GIY-YIG nuclease family protein [Agrobacterium tumefaciens]WIE36983.1 GIY-YIG nuclease family protein [Agrobacterium tumefaciens]